MVGTMAAISSLEPSCRSFSAHAASTARFTASTTVILMVRLKGLDWPNPGTPAEDARIPATAWKSNGKSLGAERCQHETNRHADHQRKAKDHEEIPQGALGRKPPARVKPVEDFEKWVLSYLGHSPRRIRTLGAALWIILFVGSVPELVLAAMPPVNRPTGASQTISMTKVDEAVVLKTVAVSHSAPNVDPADFVLRSVLCPLRIELGRIEGQATFPNLSASGDDVASAELRFINRKIGKQIVDVICRVNEPANIARWEISGISEGHIAGQSSIEGPIRFNAQWVDAQIGALKNFSVLGLLLGESNQTNGGDHQSYRASSEHRGKIQQSPLYRRFLLALIFIFGCLWCAWRGWQYFYDDRGVLSAAWLTGAVLCGLSGMGLMLVTRWEWSWAWII